MKGPTPPPPDDEAADPLLAALRQRLRDYGADPPPAAWAAIRQRVAAPARPWWRRPRRPLPLVALLLGALLVGTLAERHRQPQTTARPVAHPAATAALPGKAAAAKLAGERRRGTGAPLALAAPATGRGAGAPPRMAAAPGRTAAGSAARPTQQAGKTASSSATSKTLEAKLLAARPQLRNRASASLPQKLTPAAVVADKHAQRSATLAKTQRAAGRRVGTPPPTTPRGTGALTAGRRRPKQPKATQWPAPAKTTKLMVAMQPGAHKTRRFATPQTPTRRLASRQPPRPTHAGHPAGAPAGPLASPAGGSSALAPAFFTRPPAQAALPGERGQAGRGTALDSLALRQPGLLLAELAGPPALAARPDSTPPAPPVRRWALLVLAGPTLSYRTLGPAPALAAGHPDFARLERPALGLGAQVQVRRVLSGRWALAAGLGYHEYATRLALALKDSTTHAIRQRDTYRLLTVPVQLTYALGAPRGRLATGLLLGAEAGWYVGGRSTEGADCGCQQQVYTASGSPYRAWSLAFSLGLDLRYRLGGPASRWHLVVQPTGRYVATPFVRSEAVGFTRRQPFSLGLLTGFSWDLR